MGEEGKSLYRDCLITGASVVNLGRNSVLVFYRSVGCLATHMYGNFAIYVYN